MAARIIPIIRDIPPPAPNVPFGILGATGEVMLTPAAFEFLQDLWAALQALIAASGGAVPTPAYRLYGSLFGPLTPTPAIFDIEMNGDEVFDAGLPGSIASVDGAPSGNVSFPLRQGGVDVGSIDFAAGSLDATFTLASTLTFSHAQNFALWPPTVADPSLSGLHFTLIGRRT